MAVKQEPFGPFRSGMDPVERIAQLRSLRTLVRCHFPLPELEAALRTAESLEEAGVRALQMLDAIPTLKRRRILATFARLHQPTYNRTRSSSHIGDPDGTTTPSPPRT